MSDDTKESIMIVTVAIIISVIIVMLSVYFAKDKPKTAQTSNQHCVVRFMPIFSSKFTALIPMQTCREITPAPPSSNPVN